MCIESKFRSVVSHSDKRFYTSHWTFPAISFFKQVLNGLWHYNIKILFDAFADVLQIIH